jgi:predicted nicotinamide N-methyase
MRRFGLLRIGCGCAGFGFGVGAGVVTAFPLLRRNPRTIPCHSHSHSHDGHSFRTLLLAKARKKRPKGGRGKSKPDDDSEDGEPPVVVVAVPPVLREPAPTRTRRAAISLERGGPGRTPLNVLVAEVDDAPWWERTSNPYGARCWPSSLGVAQFLAKQPPSILQGRFVLELGCGTGLVSIVAAQCGATVLATDISNVALALTRQGWKDTCAAQQQPNNNSNNNNNNNNSNNAHSAAGGRMLSTRTFDLTSTDPLPGMPLGNKASNQGSSPDDVIMLDPPRGPIVVAGAMMYEAELAQALARRIVEAAALGAWVIIGDDDTGQREDGRDLFEAELRRGMVEETNLTWIKTTVKCKSLGWNEKQVQLLHINAPPDLLLLV